MAQLTAAQSEMISSLTFSITLSKFYSIFFLRKVTNFINYFPSLNSPKADVFVCRQEAKCIKNGSGYCREIRFTDEKKNTVNEKNLDTGSKALSSGFCLFSLLLSVCGLVH